MIDSAFAYTFGNCTRRMIVTETISTIKDIFCYIEKKLNTKLSETQKIQIRFRLLVSKQSVQDLFDELGIDYKNVEIRFCPNCGRELAG